MADRSRGRSSTDAQLEKPCIVDDGSDDVLRRRTGAEVDASNGTGVAQVDRLTVEDQTANTADILVTCLDAAMELCALHANQQTCTAYSLLATCSVVQYIVVQ